MCTALYHAIVEAHIPLAATNGGVMCMHVHGCMHACLPQLLKSTCDSKVREPGPSKELPCVPWPQHSCPQQAHGSQHARVGALQAQCHRHGQLRRKSGNRCHHRCVCSGGYAVDPEARRCSCWPYTVQRLRASVSCSPADMQPTAQHVRWCRRARWTVS